MGKWRLALLDMYKGVENLGLKSLCQLIDRFEDQLSYEIFDVRKKEEIPDSSFDIYISSGGPDSPKRGDGPWEKPFFKLLDELWEHNATNEASKKHCLFICHSFQLTCNHFRLGKPKLRLSPSFGIFPVYKTEEGRTDPLFESLPDPFYVMDSREYQIIEPDHSRIEETGARILAIEKERPHIDLERAVMAMRFSEEWVGVQFHPEANPYEAKKHFSRNKIRLQVGQHFGRKKYDKLMKGLNNPEEVFKSWDTIVPGFIERSLLALEQTETALKE